MFLHQRESAQAELTYPKFTKTDNGQYDGRLQRDRGYGMQEAPLNLPGHGRRITHSGGEEGTMKSEIDIQRGSKDQLRRAAPTSARYAAALVAAMLASSLPLPALSKGVGALVVHVHAVA